MNVVTEAGMLHFLAATLAIVAGLCWFRAALLKTPASATGANSDTVLRVVALQSRWNGFAAALAGLAALLAGGSEFV
jgi:hypothetical protein